MVSGDRFSPGVISEEHYMRIRVSGRFIAALAILTVFLCLLPSSTKNAFATPRGWIDGGPTPDLPSGDNDGVVLKNKSGVSPTVLAAGGSTATSKQVAARVYGGSNVRLLFSVMRRLDYWLFLVR